MAAVSDCAAVAGRTGDRRHDRHAPGRRGRCCPSSCQGCAGGGLLWRRPCVSRLDGASRRRLRADARGLRCDVGSDGPPGRSGSAARRRRSWQPCWRSICATCGVKRRPWILGGVAGHDLLAGDAVHALAGRIGDVPDVGHLGRVLVLGRDDVAAQRVVGALVLVESRTTRCFSTALVNSCWICLAIASGAPMIGRHRDLGERRLRRRLASAAAVSGAGVLLEPNKDPPNSEVPVSQPARPNPASAMRTTSATLGCQRRAAAASMVVTVTSPLCKTSR